MPDTENLMCVSPLWNKLRRTSVFSRNELTEGAGWHGSFQGGENWRTDPFNPVPVPFRVPDFYRALEGTQAERGELANIQFAHEPHR